MENGKCKMQNGKCKMKNEESKIKIKNSKSWLNKIENDYLMRLNFKKSKKYKMKENKRKREK